MRTARPPPLARVPSASVGQSVFLGRPVPWREGPQRIPAVTCRRASGPSPVWGFMDRAAVGRCVRTSVFLSVGCLGHMVTYVFHFIFKTRISVFPKWLHQFALPPTQCGGSQLFHSPPALGSGGLYVIILMGVR